MFEMELGPGIKVERVRSLEDDLAIALRARTVRIVAPIPGKNTIGIEVPNPLREVVRMKPLLRCKEYTDGKYALPIFLGRDASGAPMIVDLAKMPHLLVAGATGSGKSVCLNSILASFLYTRTPEQVKLILIDPKMVELSQFANAPHLACPVISDMKRAPGILDWAIVKMEERYRLLAQAGQRNIYGYNKLGKDGLRPHFAERVDDPEFPHFMPFIVIVIDELADLMLTAAKEVETSITRLAAKSRAVGIHLIVATQRPSTNVITGLIKANLPTRIGFMVSSKIDSRVILDENGAEQLLGEGDMLVMSPASTSLVRGQGAYLSEEEVKRIMEHVKTAGGPAYVPELVQRKGENSRDPDEEDELYDAAARFVFSTERGSASLLQRKFAIGYTRASRLIDMMAEEGVLGEYKGSQARELTMTLADWIALKPQARGSAAEGEFDASHAAADQGGADPRGAAPAPEIEAEAGAEAGGSAAAARDAAEDEADDDDGGDSEEIEISLDDDEPPPPPKSEGKGKRRKG
jgi:S-DNA-T family DNA segregation ATPase FtsK/SpoIIIE